MATKTEPIDEHCLVCAAVTECLNVVLEQTLNLALKAAQGSPEQYSTEDLDRLERLHVIGQVMDWAFGQTLTKTDVNGLMHIIGENLKGHGITIILHGHGAIPSERN